MKNKIIIVIVAIVSIIISTGFIMADITDNDYQAIKKAVKAEKTDRDWFHLQVINKNKGRATVKIKIPLPILEIFSDCHAQVDDIKIKGHIKINLKEILSVLTHHHRDSFLEFDDDDEWIKIWIE